MNQSWLSFLIQQGASIVADQVEHFGNPSFELEAAQNNPVIFDLGHFGILRVSGEDSKTFLQNLLSNDISELSNTRAQISSLNSAKGRVLATMLVWRYKDDYYLQIPRSLCESIQKKLSMYVLRSKVKITDLSNEIISIGISGKKMPEIFEIYLGELPTLPLSAIEIKNGYAINIAQTRWQIFIPIEFAPAIWSELRKHAHPVGAKCWDWMNIHSGIPMILPQTQEQFVAQMINLDIIGGLSFNKGCYPGQEIVARTQYLGKLKRRMYLAHIEIHVLQGSEEPLAGDSLFSADMNQPSGMVVNSAPAPGGGYDMLISMQISSIESQLIHWKSLHGPALSILSLPYPLM